MHVNQTEFRSTNENVHTNLLIISTANRAALLRRSHLNQPNDRIKTPELILVFELMQKKKYGIHSE